MDYFETVNPATEEILERYPFMSGEKIAALLAKSEEAQQAWRGVSFDEKSRLFRDLAGKIRESLAEASRQISLEMGKPLPQAEREVEKSAQACEFYAEYGPGFLEDEIVATEAKRSYVSYEPLGTILAIMPWNFPFWQVFRAAIPAILAGNAMLLKPAPNVLGTSLLLEKLWGAAGFPEGLFRVVVADLEATQRLIQDPKIQGVTATGSVRAGQAIAAQAGKYLKKCVLELGGSDPFIVLEDADLDVVIPQAAEARMQNSGQSCIAAKRFIVVKTQAREFTKRLWERMADYRFGNPLEDSTVGYGPLARADLRDHLHRQVETARQLGAKILLGGGIPSQPGYYYPATVLSEVTPEMTVAQEELFGPVATVIEVQDEAAALQVANATSFGLGASVWTRDIDRGEKFARRLDAGNVFVNAVVRSDFRLPFGGVKNSGYGRELSAVGIREFTNVKTVWVE